VNKRNYYRTLVYHISEKINCPAYARLPSGVCTPIHVMPGREADHPAAERQGRADQTDHRAAEQSAQQSVAVLA